MNPLLTPARDATLKDNVRKLVDLVVIPGDREKLQLHLEEPMFRILDELGGKRGTCKACGAHIWWFTTRKNARQIPIAEQGLAHFVDCHAASSFRKTP